MTGASRIIGLIIVGSILSCAFGCARPAGPDKNGNQPAGSQPSSPAILPQNQSQPGMGSIKVGSRPVGAAILLIAEDGGKPLPRGSTPTTVTDVAPGKYTVALELRGYKPFQKSVEVKADQTVTVTADLAKEATR